jgi:hypothetical protein
MVAFNVVEGGPLVPVRFAEAAQAVTRDAVAPLNESKKRGIA